MATENSRLWMVAAAVGAVLAIPILGARFGGPATTVTNVMSGTEPVDISKSQAAQKRLANVRPKVPPAFGQPVAPVGISDRDADASARIVAQTKVRSGRRGGAERYGGNKKSASHHRFGEA